jgi:catechol 2,3-dioxygenase-like lactoylglutathione lyase family enzyme
VERVDGIGGFFFRAKHPEALASWYREHLGIEPPPTSYDGPVWVQREGPTVLAPFPERDESLVLGSGGWGINFRVADLDAIVAQLREAGIDVEIDPQEYPNGRFAQLSDPEGNAIQLWEPSGVAGG